LLVRTKREEEEEGQKGEEDVDVEVGECNRRVAYIQALRYEREKCFPRTLNYPHTTLMTSNPFKWKPGK